MIIDFHSHILPGIDDGAKTWEEFLEMAAIAQSEGVTHMVCTPHYIPNEEEFTLTSYKKLFAEAEEKLRDNNISLDLIPGSEVFAVPEVMRALEEKKLMTINDQGKYLLIEFPRSELPTYAKEIIFALKLKGVTPIIAHPERNKVFADRPELLIELIKQGAICQLNTGSLQGIFGERVKATAEIFVQSNLIHLIGSDAHSPRTRSPRFKGALESLRDLVGEEILNELVTTNPIKVLKGEEMEVRVPHLQRPKLNFWHRITRRMLAIGQ